MSRAAILLLIVVAFASGLSSGVVVGRSRALHGGDIPSRFEVLDAMAEEVGLSAEQKKKCAAIQEVHHPLVAKAKAKIAPELAAIRSDLRAQMFGVLETDEQRRKFQEFCARRDQQRAVADK